MVEISAPVQQRLERVASKNNVTTDDLANTILDQALRLIEEREELARTENGRTVPDSVILAVMDRYDDALRRLAQ